FVYNWSDRPISLRYAPRFFCSTIWLSCTTLSALGHLVRSVSCPKLLPLAARMQTMRTQAHLYKASVARASQSHRVSCAKSLFRCRAPDLEPTNSRGLVSLCRGQSAPPRETPYFDPVCDQGKATVVRRYTVYNGQHYCPASPQNWKVDL